VVEDLLPLVYALGSAALAHIHLVMCAFTSIRLCETESDIDDSRFPISAPKKKSAGESSR
jgi:hypothetical protein